MRLAVTMSEPEPLPWGVFLRRSSTLLFIVAVVLPLVVWPFVDAAGGAVSTERPFCFGDLDLRVLTPIWLSEEVLVSRSGEKACFESGAELFRDVDDVTGPQWQGFVCG